MNARRFIAIWWTISLTGMVLVWPVSVRAARARTKKLGSEIIIQDNEGRYVRGWAKFERSKIRFTNVKGDTSILDKKGVTIFKRNQLEKQFRKKMRDVKTEEEDETSEYVKLFPLGKNQQLYEMVASLADKLIRRNPSNPSDQALEARAWAEGKLKLMKKTMEGPSAFDLSEEDIQKIRFALISTDRPEKRLRVAFKRNVCNRFLSQMINEGIFDKDSRREFLSKPPGERVAIIKRHTKNKYQPDIVIYNDPPVIARFRRQVIPLLNRSCARTCHSAEKMRFKLRMPMHRARHTYTNFVIMETYPAKAGRILDHAVPKRSLLATYTLPQESVPAELAHPVKITPVFRSLDEPGYKMLMQWLQSLPTQMPDYGIEMPTWPVTPDAPASRPAATKPHSTAGGK